VITGEGRLDEQSLVGKLVSEVATRARQGGVPCHVVCGTRALDAMGARVLDLERVLEASSLSELRAAGAGLAELI
jgi:glycerate 2-kinase